MWKFYNSLGALLTAMRAEDMTIEDAGGYFGTDNVEAALQQLGGLGEIDYTQFTSPVSVTGGSEGAATTIVTASAITADGSSAYLIEFFAPNIDGYSQQDPAVGFALYENGSSIGIFGYNAANVSSGGENSETRWPVHLSRRLVPSSGSRTYSVRAWHSGTNNPTVTAGAGGSGNYVPGFIRITKVT